LREQKNRVQELSAIVAQFDTDKAKSGYVEPYARYFAPLRNLPIKLFEIGILRGGSLLTWQEYFPFGLIVGLDINAVTLEHPHDRVRMYKGEQQDTRVLDRIAADCAPEGFDIIIDDAAHIGVLARTTFWHLFENHLKPGGMYVIEDWGTGYWPSWPDGAPPPRQRRDVSPLNYARLAKSDPNFGSHNFGMVGFIKELVDECGRADITHPEYGEGPRTTSRFGELVLMHGQAFITKAPG
jgi:hypothetical protein